MTEVMLRDRWKKEKNMNRVNVISTDTIKKVGHKTIKLCQTYLLNKWLSILVLLYALKSSGMSNTGMLTCCNSCNCVSQGVGSLREKKFHGVKYWAMATLTTEDQ